MELSVSKSFKKYKKKKHKQNINVLYLSKKIKFKKSKKHKTSVIAKLLDGNTIKLQYYGLRSYLNVKQHASEFLPQEILKKAQHYQMFEFPKKRGLNLNVY